MASRFAGDFGEGMGRDSSEEFPDNGQDIHLLSVGH